VRNYFIKGGWKYGKDGLVICYWQMAGNHLEIPWAFRQQQHNNNSNNNNNPASRMSSSAMPQPFRERSFR
jgi:hypothetical protein